MKFITLVASLISFTVAQSYVETLIQNNLTAAVDAIQKAHLTEAISNLPSGTLFIPTNDAFEKIKNLPLTDEALRVVLLTHAVIGTGQRAAELENLKSLPSLNPNERLTFEVVNGKMTVNGIPVVQADIVTSKGIIHVIERVIIPSSMKSMVSTTTSTTQTPAVPIDAAKSSALSVFAGALSMLALLFV